MVNLTIDNKPVTVEDGTTILEAAKKVGINIPTLCFLKEINEIGACRICVVEGFPEEKQMLTTRKNVYMDLILDLNNVLELHKEDADDQRRV